MTHEVLKAIVLTELDIAEEELTPDQRIALAIEVTIRLLSIPLC